MYYFNKIVSTSFLRDLKTGITVQDKPLVLKQAEESAGNYGQSYNVKGHGDMLGSNGTGKSKAKKEE